MEIPVPNRCHICEGPLTIERLRCHSCGCAVEGGFELPRLARLSPEDQKFVELFMSVSGSLKDMAAAIGVSYPTVRARLDNVIAALTRLADDDKKQREELIDRVEKGEIPPSLAARILEEA